LDLDLRASVPRISFSAAKFGAGIEAKREEPPARMQDSPPQKENFLARSRPRTFVFESARPAFPLYAAANPGKKKGAGQDHPREAESGCRGDHRATGHEHERPCWRLLRCLIAHYCEMRSELKRCTPHRLLTLGVVGSAIAKTAGPSPPYSGNKAAKHSRRLSI